MEGYQFVENSFSLIDSLIDSAAVVQDLIGVSSLSPELGAVLGEGSHLDVLACYSISAEVLGKEGFLMGVVAYHYNHLDLAMGRYIVGGRSSGPVGHRRAVGMKVRRLLAGRKGSLVHICNKYISILLVVVDSDSMSSKADSIAIVESSWRLEETNPYCDMIISIKFCQR
jgi:hypothetical protein